MDGPRSSGGGPVARVLQAVAFGTLHVVGFPAGAVGVGLSFLYGAMLGIIRVATGGLRVAVIAHVATNAALRKFTGWPG
jgi:membrane protease YdiL (CAAX protease family)